MKQQKLWLFIYFEHKWQTLTDFSLSNVRICLFVNWISLGFGQLIGQNLFQLLEIVMVIFNYFLTSYRLKKKSFIWKNCQQNWMKIIIICSPNVSGPHRSAVSSASVDVGHFICSYMSGKLWKVTTRAHILGSVWWKPWTDDKDTSHVSGNFQWSICSTRSHLRQIWNVFGRTVWTIIGLSLV